MVYVVGPGLSYSQGNSAVNPPHLHLLRILCSADWLCLHQSSQRDCRGVQIISEQVMTVDVQYFQGDLISAFSATSLSSLTNPPVLTLIINNAVLGIVTSLFLKKLNSILKAFASALELVITAVLSVPILGIPLTPTTVMALGEELLEGCDDDIIFQVSYPWRW